jgi:hypothetical protein
MISQCCCILEGAHLQAHTDTNQRTPTFSNFAYCLTLARTAYYLLTLHTDYSYCLPTLSTHPGY